MTIPTIFESCRPRRDVLEGAISEADFAADLSQVIAGSGPDDYTDPERFLANTYPTRGLKNLLENVCRRLSGTGGEVASIFRLDTTYGGGKSHGLIALCHAARSGATAEGIEEFLNPAFLPKGKVRIAAFDGENANPTDGRKMRDGNLAFTPWGEIASELGGRAGYDRVRKSDEARTAPGADTIRELFGGEPTLILLDELSVYLRKVGEKNKSDSQFTAFLTSLFKAVESTPNAALVFTLALGKDGRTNDAYGDENRFIADWIAEAESVAARKATLLNPTEEDETVQVLRRRLFESIDDAAVDAVVEGYRRQWNLHSESLPRNALTPEAIESFRSSYPFHPEVLQTLTAKTATLSNFQRVRGMLRLLSSAVSHLWSDRPDDATAIHLHHLDPGHEPIRREFVTRLGQSAFEPAISNDISAGRGNKESLAQEIDREHHRNLPPYASYVARTIFMHTLAYNEPLKGISPEQLRYSVLGPATDISFVEEARKRFCTDSAYLDDRPGTPMRFLAEANLNQIIRREEDHVDLGNARAELDDCIREIFEGKSLDAVFFPGGPYDVADDVADGRPKQVVVGYEAVNIGTAVEEVPELVETIFERKGAEGSALRVFRNNLVFVIAEGARIDDMRRKALRRLALREMKRSDRLADLAEHQQDKVRELEQRSSHELALAIQHCYRHLFYPSRYHVGKSKVDLAHTVLETHSASERPGNGQLQIVRTLRELDNLRLPEDEPLSPTYVRDRTPLRNGHMTVMALRNEFRRNPALPILIGDDVFIRGVRRGIEQGEYVYQRGDLLFGPGDPAAAIDIDEQSVLYTMADARQNALWPRIPVEPPTATTASPPEEGGKPKDEDPKPKGGTEFQIPTDREYLAEGILKEALVRIWEQAEQKKESAIASLTIRVFEADVAFRLLGAVGSVPNATSVVTFSGGYETLDNGEFNMDFSGTVADAQPVREFLEPQLRAAASTQFESSFELSFEHGLMLEGEAPKKLTDRLCRYANGDAQVTASPRTKA